DVRADDVQRNIVLNGVVGLLAGLLPKLGSDSVPLLAREAAPKPRRNVPADHCCLDRNRARPAKRVVKRALHAPPAQQHNRCGHRLLEWSLCHELPIASLMQAWT